MNINQVGQTFSLEFSYTQEEVNEFIKITGDDNPIHHDEAYARTTLFKKPIIHGFLGGAMFSRIFGTLFPGEGTIYLSQSMKFRAPMYVGEIYTAHMEVTELNAERHSCVVTSRILGPDGKDVIVGEARIMNKNKIGVG